MYDSFKAVCLTHHNASVEVREKFALSEKETQDFLLYLKDIFELTEALVVSTCNRTEIYYHSERELNEAILQALVAFKGDSSLARYIKNFQIFQGREAIKHLFEVALGLNSQILGDIQIINQVKKAYQYSTDLQMAGAFLHRLLHSIFFTNKRISQETSFRDGAASVAYAAVELLQSIQMLWENPKILVLGIGEIGADVCKNLQGKFSEVRICNRTAEKALALAEATGFVIADFANVWQEIEEADVVISSLSVANFVSKEKFVGKEILKQKYFIDLSVPRSIATDIEEISGFLVYDIDHLHERTQETLNRRKAEISAVNAIMQEAIAEFLDWSREMEISPVVQKIKNALEQIRKEELSKYSKKISQQEAELLDKITGNLMQKILKFPVLQLKAACKRGEADTLIDVLSELFDLEKAKYRNRY